MEQAGKGVQVALELGAVEIESVVGEWDGMGFEGR